MNKNLRGVSVAILILSILFLILLLIPEDSLPPKPTEPPTPIPQDTATPTSTNTLFVAELKVDSPCRSGTGEEFDVIATVPQGKAVMAMGKNSAQADWILTRQVGLQDCWIETRFVRSPDIGLLEIVPTPQPYTPTSRATITLVPTQTLTPTGTKTPVGFRPTTTRRPGEATNTPTRTPRVVKTTPPVVVTTPPIVITTPPIVITTPPIVITTPPIVITTPPVVTPSRKKACNDGRDNDGDGLKDLADPQCRNRGDDDESNR